MRTSCINHPQGPLLVIREWQIKLCNDNHCAAALLSFLEYWHNVKLGQQAQSKHANSVAERFGEARPADERLLQWHSTKQLKDGLLGLYKDQAIANAIDVLVTAGFVKVTRNPNPRFAFDQTKHFELQVEAINDAIRSRFGENEECIPRNQETTSRKRGITVPEITSKEGGVSRAPMHVLIKGFTEAYKAEFGSAYPFHKRDLKPAQELAAALGPERVIELATWAWKRASSYLRGRSVTIHGMHAVLAEVQAAHKMDVGKRKSAPTAHVKPEDVVEGEEWKAKTF